MNEYIILVLGAYLIYIGILSFVNPEKYTQRMKDKYTPESLIKFAKVTGVGCFVSAVVFIYGGLNRLGVIKFGPDFSDSNVAIKIYGYVLTFYIIVFLVGRFVILKPLKDASPKKQKNIEDEDF